jgi:hypothetical protein
LVLIHNIVADNDHILDIGVGHKYNFELYDLVYQNIYTHHNIQAYLTIEFEINYKQNITSYETTY